jgi:D-arabinose 5-phosphate isomerase GutQ
VTPPEYFGDVFDTVPASEYWVATGWGRVRHIADKVSASLASTGTPSYFVDAASESHGLKLLCTSSRVLFFHRRGGSASRLKRILEAIPMSVPVDVITDQPEGWAPRAGNVFPIVAPDPIAPHAEPDILALAIGDSILAGLESARRFSELDFLKDHPKGSLGKNIAGAQARPEVAYLPPPIQALGALKEERDGLQALLVGTDDIATQGWLDIFARPCRRVITTGMGKPGYCMRYLAYLLNELGRSAFYLHPAEGVHGDLGRIGKDSLVISYSHSGETEEILNILPRMKERGATLLALTNNPGSTMGKAADAVLKAGAPEVDPIRKAPTGSTTAALSLAASLVCADSFSKH